MHPTSRRFTVDNSTFDYSYFSDEVREGFFVSSMMKRFWAAQLAVLSHIDGVCQKYGIKWFADCGSLLGAVRHRGFIPWDDDLDICMLRHDYERFFEVASSELPDEYTILSIHTEETYETMIGRIVNSHSIDFSEKHMSEYFGCPYSVGVDIFPLDGVSDDPEFEITRKENIAQITKAIHLIKSGCAGTPDCSRLLNELEKRHGKSLPYDRRLLNRLHLLIEEQYTLCDSRTCDRVALMPLWATNDSHVYEKEWYSDSIMLPFENTFIPVPIGYEDAAGIEYGNFMKIYRNTGLHNYPVYSDQEAILAKETGSNPFRYTMEAGNGVPAENRSTFRAVSKRIISSLTRAHAQLKSQSDDGLIPETATLPESCQSLAISLGNLFEGESPDLSDAVHCLEEYCELAYELSQSLDTAVVEKMDNAVGAVKDLLNSYLAGKRKQVVFLSFKAKWWDAMDAEYRRALSDPGVDVYVISVPYLEGDKLRGITGAAGEDASLLPEHVKLTRPEDFDISARRPDIIYTQYPYDEHCTTMDVPAMFYSKNLITMTDRLVYIPGFTPDINLADSCSMAALESLVEQPAVYYADQIVLSSPEMKTAYAEILRKITGDRIVGESDDNAVSVALSVSPEEKLVVTDAAASKSVSSGGEFVVRISAPFLLKNGEGGIEKIKRSLETVRDSAAGLACVFSPGDDVSEVRDIDGDLWDKYLALLEWVRNDSDIALDVNNEAAASPERFSGYYGSPGYLANYCRNAQVPVMIISDI
ncbi:MAG: LicD family protein [Eubacterium sp.]|nr:LicD family protein [Eubacterium sp.]